MAEIAFEPQVWHWVALGMVLLILEIFTAGAVFLGMGLAALGVAVLVWLGPAMSWQMQILAFAVLAILSVFAIRSYFKAHPLKSDQPLLNQRGHQYVGRVFTLSDPIVNGQGKIKVDDSIWKIRGLDCESGARVRVNGVDGVVLTVEPADA
jgi:membrane protein implicated in regulation of membrane protease activity